MKKLNLFLFFIGIIFCFCLCSENDKNDQSTYSDSENIGKIHNSGLDYIRDKLSTSSKTQSDNDTEENIPSRTLLELALEHVNNSSQQDQKISLSENEINSLTSALDDIRDNLTTNNISNKWVSQINSLSTIHFLSSRETQAISELKEVFVQASKLPSNSQSEYIHNKIEYIKYLYQDLYYNNELFSGLINIGLNSNDYWKDYYKRPLTKSAGDEISSEETPESMENIPFAVLAYADGVGYLIGWVAAVWEDSNSSGGLKKENQWNRVGKGGASAISFSSGGILSTRLSLEEEAIDTETTEVETEISDLISRKSIK